MKRLLLLLLLMLGCANQVSPPPAEDGGLPFKDGGAEVEAEIILERANLAPAAETAESDRHRITGRLKGSGSGAAESANYRIRGGVVPSTR